MHWVYPHILWLLLLVPVYGFGEYSLRQWRKRARLRYAQEDFHSWLFPVSAPVWRPAKPMAWALAYVLLVLAWARPQGGPLPGQPGGKNQLVYFVLDCSQSMLAQDLKPNRLLAAKSAIEKIAARLPASRLGLIAFSGKARVVCPATDDDQAFAAAVQNVQVGQIPEKGSCPAAGISLAFKKTAGQSGDCLVLLFSDGEENRQPALAAVGNSAGVRILCVGMGTEAGGWIPAGSDFWGKPMYKVRQGQRVRSRLQILGLQRLAVQSGGKYLAWEDPMRTAAAAVAATAEILLAESAGNKTMLHYEFYPWLIGMAFCLLWLEWIWPGRQKDVVC